MSILNLVIQPSVSFSVAVQTAIFDKLNSSAPLMAEITAIYDDVPQAIEAGDSASFPYVTIGEDVHTDISTDLELMNLVSITIHTWSRTAGRAQTKKIQGLVYSALNRANLVHWGFKFVNINSVSVESRLESDGFTRHGIQTFNLIIEEL